MTQVSGAEIRAAQAALGLMDTWRWGVVQSVSPLTARLDGDLTANTPIINAVGNLFVGDVVWVQQNGQRYVAIGRRGAPRIPDRWQRVGSTERTTDTSASPGGTTAFNILSLTIPTAFCTAGRIFRVNYSGHVQGNTAGSFIDVQLKIGLNAATGGTQIDGCYVSTNTVGRTMEFSKTVEYVYGTNGETDGASPQNLVVVGVPGSGSWFGVASAPRKAGIYVDVATV